MSVRKVAKTLVALVLLFHIAKGQHYLEDEAHKLMNLINKDYAEILKKKSNAEWLLEVTDEPGAIGDSVLADDEYNEFIAKMSRILAKYSNVQFADKDLERQIRRFPKPTYESLPKEDYEALNEATDNLGEIYANVELCSYRQPEVCNLTLVPDIQDILHNSNDIEEIKYYWIKWRTATGQRNQASFEKFVEYYKKAAAANHYAKPSDMWFKDFDDNNILDKVEKLIQNVHPLFLQFHAHVRYMLQQKYGPELIKSDRPYPLHLSEIFLGEVYRYQEDGFVELPYPDKLLPNVTEELLRQNYTAKRIFDVSRDFYESIGFPKLSDTFWKTNTKPIASVDNNLLICFSKAWQTYDEKEVAYSYCPDVDYRRFLSAHGAMSIVYYYKSFQSQPLVFRGQPLPNFEDVFSETMELSAQSTKYLEKLGLITKESVAKESRINKLYLKGMETVFLLPILFILEKYRVQILNREIQSWDNCKYWKLTEKYTGSIPAVERSNDDFDAPAKLLTAVDAEYTSNILAIMMQYQVFKSLCERVGEYVPGDPDYPLDNCDLSGHKEVGEILSKAMALGSSKHWREVLYILTGQSTVDASGYLEYFKPLLDWLLKDNSEKKLIIGWEATNTCISSAPTNQFAGNNLLK